MPIEIEQTKDSPRLLAKKLKEESAEDVKTLKKEGEVRVNGIVALSAIVTWLQVSEAILVIPQSSIDMNSTTL